MQNKEGRDVKIWHEEKKKRKKLPKLNTDILNQPFSDFRNHKAVTFSV